jgi:small subunit ribosomal protein S9
MENKRYAATGRRKESVARVTIFPGKGVFTVNGREVGDYLTRETLVTHAQTPLVVTDMLGKLDVTCSTNGGGISGQAGAVRLGLARALCLMDGEMHPVLRQNGLMTRDAREVERKKYGQPKARKKFQFSKR